MQGLSQVCKIRVLSIYRQWRRRKAAAAKWCRGLAGAGFHLRAIRATDAGFELLQDHEDDMTRKTRR
jgi:hypothetical protein